MSKENFIALVNALGGPECIVTIVLDNSMIIRYFDKDHTLDLDKDVKTIGGVDYIIEHTFVEDNRPEKRPLVKHEISSYHPMECIQCVNAVETEDDRLHLDKISVYDA